MFSQFQNLIKHVLDDWIWYDTFIFDYLYNISRSFMFFVDIFHTQRNSEANALKSLENLVSARGSLTINHMDITVITITQK